MIDAFLLSDGSEITSSADSAPVEISGAATRVFLLTLSVTSVIEQQSIELAVFTSADGTAWDAKPVATLPQKFYLGEYPLLVDLTASPDAKFLRVHWDVNRWGRGTNTPQFGASLRLREVPAEMLREKSA